MNEWERALWVQRVLDVWALHGNRWVQGSYAVTRGGLNVSWAHTGVRGFCLAGAIEHVAAERDDVRRMLYRDFALTLGLDPLDAFALEHWNDQPGRCFADVREACLEALRRPVYF